MKEFTVRKAHYSDIPEMVRLLEDLFSIETDFVVDSQKQSDGLNLILERPESGIVFAASGGGKLVGMVTGQLGVSTAEGGLTLRVEDLIVDKKCRGRGLGGRLLEEMASWAIHKGVKRMELLADKTNGPALQFYRSLGWQETKMICLHKKNF